MGPTPQESALSIGPIAIAPVEAPPEVQDLVPAYETRGVWRLALDVFLEHRLAVFGVGVVVFMVLFCFIGPLIYHTNQVDSNLNDSFLAPGAGHVLGTDQDGFDVMGRLMVGGQTSIEVGIAAAFIATAFGVIWGAVAGFFGRFVDAVMMRLVDVFLAIPPLFLLLFLASAFQPITLMTLIIVVAIDAWLIPARLVRAETLTLRTRDYVQAVTMMGGSGARIVFRHIVPNAIGTIMVNATFQVADAIILVAALGFLGLGIPLPATNWGRMLSDGVTFIFDGYWWLIYPAGIAIVLTVVAFNFIGDGLRDALEVRLQKR
ncbi:MAG: ABC transporter permease [Candidatus Dormibacteraeota bacterium]|nr:ABC transporter permease [Candidatus Dormibacteraeota bacterium]MBV9524544.1 ABC transporter permease [Candidatus Dormibacteraeota bacterium]